MRFYLAAALIALVLRVSPAVAATFTVNSTADVNDLTPGNSLCVAYLVVFPPFVLPFCTLWAAIEEANGLPGPDRIVLPAGVYTLAIPGPEDAGTSGDLDITESVILSGTGSDKTIIDAGGLDRGIDLFGGADTEVTISGLTIRNGSLPPGLPQNEAGGAGIRNDASLVLDGVRLQGNRVNGSSQADVGGGLFNSATCVLRNSTIVQNRAAIGGGVANSGPLKIQASTLNGNQAVSGAGLFNEGVTAVVNSTVSGNRALESTLSHGGGLLNRGDLALVQNTIANNQASEGGGGISNEGALSLVNTLVAGNMSGDCDLPQAISSLGHNLDSDATCGLSEATDLSGVQPKLDSLAPHGGPTSTHGLLLGSPAVDRGKDLRTEGIITDQRGTLRPQGRAFDIGAFETDPRSLVPLLAPLLLGETHL